MNFPQILVINIKRLIELTNLYSGPGEVILQEQTGVHQLADLEKGQFTDFKVNCYLRISLHTPV